MAHYTLMLRDTKENDDKKESKAILVIKKWRIF